MKKLILSLLFLMSFFALNAQEIKESETTQTENPNASEITFSLDKKSENEVPKIIVNKPYIWGHWNDCYKLSDNTELSNKQLDALLKANADQIFVKKAKIYKGLSYASIAGILASFAVNLYADAKGWENMEDNSKYAGALCLLTAISFGSLSNVSRQIAVDSYNLNVLGMNQNK